jgi:hypothetical protein
MGVPTSEVGYTSTTARRGDHVVTLDEKKRLILHNIPMSLYLFKNVLRTPEDWNPNIVKNFIASFFYRKSILYQRDTTNDRDKII